MKNIAVIGAGAAGMMAAITAADNGAKVTVYEKNEKAGKKIYITGKGRCNVTTNVDTNDFFGNVRRGEKFLYSAVYGYDHTSVMEFFEKNGCALKVERGERVFPVSDHSSDIIKTLVFAMQKRHIRVKYGSEVTSIGFDEDKVCSITVNDKDVINVDAVIVCTGGLSYESTGCSGDGYRFAKKAGHKVEKCYPSLVPLTIKENWCMSLQGLSLKNVAVKMEEEALVKSEETSNAEISSEKSSKKKKKKKPAYEGFGEMLFTHFGISGPLILTASTFYEEGKKYILHLDLKPALSKEQLDKRIIRDFEEGNRKEYQSILRGLFPAKLVPVMIELTGISADKKVSEISQKDRQRLVDTTKDMGYPVEGSNPVRNRL